MSNPKGLCDCGFTTNSAEAMGRHVQACHKAVGPNSRTERKRRWVASETEDIAKAKRKQRKTGPRASDKARLQVSIWVVEILTNGGWVNYDGVFKTKADAEEKARDYESYEKRVVRYTRAPEKRKR